MRSKGERVREYVCRWHLNVYTRSSASSVRPSEEKSTLFCASDRRIRSFVAGQVILVASGC